MKHTKAPWTAHHVPRDRSMPADDPGHYAIQATITAARTGSVGDTMNRDYCISPEEDRANAQLMAAAPDMLAALKGWVSWMDAPAEAEDQTVAQEDAMFDAMRAAIAAATDGAE